MSNGEPTAKEMFLNLSETAKKSFELFRSKGVIFADEETFLRRIDTCLSCEKLFTTMGVNRCKVCGCGLNIKVRLAGACCPIAKWKSMTGEEVAKLIKKNE